MKPLLVVADAHLTRDDPEVDVLVGFLERAGPGAATVAILGDLFNVWFGRPKFALPHHRRVLDALSDLKRAGVRLVYVEGNRDFHLRRAHLGAPFDAIAEDAIVETHAGGRVWLTHGDAINLDDRPYRAWKALSKSAPVYGVFALLPGAWGVRLGESLERRLSGTNVRHKSRFPMEHCRAYAASVLDGGCRDLVMGHFHEERVIPVGAIDGLPARAWVMPAWRGTHRYLAFEEGREPEFRTWPG